MLVCRYSLPHQREQHSLILSALEGGSGSWMTWSGRTLWQQHCAHVKVTAAYYTPQCDYSDAFWELMDFTFHNSTLILRSFVAVRYLGRSNSMDKADRIREVQVLAGHCMEVLILSFVPLFRCRNYPNGSEHWTVWWRTIILTRWLPTSPLWFPCQRRRCG